MQLAMPWLRRLVTGQSPRRPGPAFGSAPVVFVVDKVALGQVSSCSVFSCLSFHSGCPLSYIIWGWTIGQRHGLTEVASTSETLVYFYDATSIFRAHSHDGGGSKHLWNVGQFLRDYVHSATLHINLSKKVAVTIIRIIKRTGVLATARKKKRSRWRRIIWDLTSSRRLIWCWCLGFWRPVDSYSFPILLVSH
jgi:hypothetical protein